MIDKNWWMQRWSTRHLAAWLSVITLLAGCAGSHYESDLAAGAAAATPYSGPPVVLRRTNTVGSSGPNGAESAISQYSLSTNSLGYGVGIAESGRDALAYFNAKRREVGLSPITFAPAVAESATAHAHYLMRNGGAGHVEQSGNPDFAGADVADRLRSRLSVNGASEVLTRYGNSLPDDAAIRHLFAAPYHRGVILFDWKLGGAALLRENDSVLVVDFANIGSTLPANELIAYPYDGETDVPTTWTDNEVPDPLGDDGAYRGKKVGYPITLSGGPNAHIEWRRATLSDASGHDVPCQIAALRIADSARNTAICTPLSPLKAHTHYRIQAVGVLTQLTRFPTIAPFSLRWSFTTGD